MTDRSRMPLGRTEVPVEDGKYTVVIDYRPRMEGLAVLRHGEPWLLEKEIVGSKMLIAMAHELERCRDLLCEIADDFDPDKVLGPPCGPKMLAKIMEVLPRGYELAIYLEADRAKAE